MTNIVLLSANQILLRSSCSQEFSSEMQNANNFSITFYDIEGKNNAEK